MSGSGCLTDGRTRRKGTFEVGKTGVRQARGRPIRWPVTWPLSQWKPLLAALAISLAVHVLVLTMQPAPVAPGDGRAPVLSVTLTGALVAPRPQPRSAPVAQPPAVTEPPAPLPPRANTPAPSPVPAPVAAAQRPPQRQPAAVPSEEERAAALANEPEQPASPLSSPELGEVARKVSGRRLQAWVWIDEQGRVGKAFVKRNEISEEVASLLEQALGTVRFAPAQQGGRPVASELQTRLCFDDAGTLVAADDECLRAPTEPTGTPPR